jgi:hypothetical protein
MAFQAGQEETREEIKVLRVVEIPEYKTVIVDKPVIKEKPYEVSVPVFIEMEISQPVFKRVIVEVPEYVIKEIIVEKVKIIEV